MSGVWFASVATVLVCAMPGENLNPALQPYVAARIAEFEQISPERREVLAGLTRYVQRRIDAGKPVRLTFICTHNSRRSHLSQIWAQTSAAAYGLRGIETFSGGTAATAFNSRAVAALQRAGFDIPTPAVVENPHYQVRLGPDFVMDCFSKVHDQSPNPTSGYCAVMICTDADQNCPVMPGADERLSIPFDDPKIADGTPEEAAQYDERCRQIAREMLFVFSQVRQPA
jgi:arsenate reductase